MTEETKRIVEINGVKIEVDLRSAKRIDTFKVGDNVKVYRKEHNDVMPGVIVDFANFQEMPTLTIAYYKESTYSFESSKIEFIHYNTQTQDKYELVFASKDEIQVSGDSVVRMFNHEIDKYQRKADELRKQLDFFKERFLKPCGIEE